MDETKKIKVANALASISVIFGAISFMWLLYLVYYFFQTINPRIGFIELPELDDNGTVLTLAIFMPIQMIMAPLALILGAVSYKLRRQKLALIGITLSALASIFLLSFLGDKAGVGRQPASLENQTQTTSSESRTLTGDQNWDQLLERLEDCEFDSVKYYETFNYIQFSKAENVLATGRPPKENNLAETIARARTNCGKIETSVR